MSPKPTDPSSATPPSTSTASSSAAEPPSPPRPIPQQTPKTPPIPEPAAAAGDAAAAAEAPPPPDTVDSVKDKGNAAIRAGNFSAAVLHYSFAIKLSGSAAPDAILHSNRSLAFLRLGQLYYANEDAERAIQLRPDWAKAHFRRAEVQCAAGQYDSALLSYARALQLQPSDGSIMQAAKKVAALSTEEAKFEKQLPWAGAGIGIIVGVIIVLADQLATKAPSFRHPALMVLLVIVVAGIGFGLARFFRYFTLQQRRGMLERPVDLLDEFKRGAARQGDGANASDDGAEQALAGNRSRYSKAQARQRFRKGKT